MDPLSNKELPLRKKSGSTSVAPAPRKYRKYSPQDKTRFFEAKERLGTVAAAARELGFTPAACLMWTKDDGRVPRTKYTPAQKAEFFVLLDLELSPSYVSALPHHVRLDRYHGDRACQLDSEKARTRKLIILTNLALADITPDGSVRSSGPRACGSTTRRAFTPTRKLEFLTQYEEVSTAKRFESSYGNMGCIPPRSPSGARCVTPLSCMRRTGLLRSH